MNDEQLSDWTLSMALEACHRLRVENERLRSDLKEARELLRKWNKGDAPYAHTDLRLRSDLEEARELLRKWNKGDAPYAHTDLFLGYCRWRRKRW
jgi:hypothetical protein